MSDGVKYMRIKPNNTTQSNFLVYKHTCKANNKAYIGQTNNYEKRCREHKCKSNGCRLFARAIKKHGWDSFEHEILKDNLTVEDANYWEERFIGEFGSLSPGGYNLKTGGDNSLYSEESKKRMSLAQKGEKGSGFGRLGADNKSSKKYLFIFPDGRIEIAIGMAAFCRENGLSPSGANAVIAGWRQHHKKYYCEYYHDNKYSKEQLKWMGENWAELMRNHVRYKKGVGNPIAKKYLIITPVGEQFIVKGLEQFCNENFLRSANMQKVISGDRKHHKGHYCEYLVQGKYSDEELKQKGTEWAEWWDNYVPRKKGEENKTSKRYLITTPIGEVLNIIGLQNFCEYNGLSVKNMSGTANGKQKTHSGYHCFHHSDEKYQELLLQYPQQEIKRLNELISGQA